MQNFNIETHIGADGILHLDLPVTVKNTDMRVTVICQPTAAIEPTEKQQITNSSWRKRMSFMPVLKTTPEKLLESVADDWESYL
jgi:hypothetical protein